MSLLQIHEPGETPLPHQDELAVGIDLGTTHSVVAISSQEKPTVLHDICGGALVPSVVWYTPDGKIHVGKNAVAAMAEGKTNVIKSIKRLMGRGLNDAMQVNAAQSYPIDQTISEGMVRLNVRDKKMSPVEISADILRHLRSLAEQAMGKPVTKAVITVPAYFDDAARTATKDAARIAGLEVLRLINEPTAAALAYGLEKSAEGIYAIYDMGGGTFDLSLLLLEKGVFRVLASSGDLSLGGDDFDYAIAERMLRYNKIDIAKADPEAIKKLMILTRDIKERLSIEEKIDVTFDWMGESLKSSISRNQYEGLIIDHIRRSLEICEQVLADADLKKEDIKGIVMVGGSTRIPLVRDEAERFFGKRPLTDVNPDEVVAVGAALQAEALTQGSNNLLLDVVPLSLGIETMGGLVEKLIHRNTPIPTSVSQEFTTYQDNQTGLIIHVLQGEREMVGQCRSLARFELKGIPAMMAGMARIKITFSVDADGLLNVAAEETTSGVRQSVDVKPSYGLSEQEIEHMLTESMKYAESDILERLLTEARIEANRTIIELESAVRSDPKILVPGEADVFESQIRILKQAIEGTDRDRIDFELSQLAGITRSFAERRMNRAIQKALHGQNVDDYSQPTKDDPNA